MMMVVRDAVDNDLEGIARILNHAIVHTTAVWSNQPVDVEDRRGWLADRAGHGYPVLVATDDTDESAVVGFASFGDFRPWPGYRPTVEWSVYVDPNRRQEGIGRRLLIELAQRARRLEKRVVVAGIEASNTASLQLHRSLGFVDGGTLPGVGEKFGRSLDLALLYLRL